MSLLLRLGLRLSKPSTAEKKMRELTKLVDATNIRQEDGESRFCFICHLLGIPLVACYLDDTIVQLVAFVKGGRLFIMSNSHVRYTMHNSLMSRNE